MSKPDKGFTLIELLVVIAIIGSLSGIVLVSLGEARTKARDATRQGDIRQVVSAMEMYYGEFEEYVHQDVEDKTDGTGDISRYLHGLHDPRCPDGNCVAGFSDYAIKRNDQPAFCDNPNSNAESYNYFCIYATLENPVSPCSTDEISYMVASNRGTKIVCGDIPSVAGECTCFH